VLRFVRFVVAIVLGTSLAIPGATSAALPLTFCDVLPGLAPNVWQGLGVRPGSDDQWDNDANWSLGIAPVRLSNPYVCIPAGGLPVIRSGQAAELLVLDVAPNGVLQVDGGGDLSVLGDNLTPSTIRGRLELAGGTLGGPGQIVVTDGGIVDVAASEVDLADRLTLLVHGLLRVHEGGSLAAAHGTRLELLPHQGATPGTGTLRFDDDGDYLEGDNDLGIAQLGTVVNQGQIIKSGGIGTSLVTGSYSQPAPGAVEVSSGTLLLPSGSSTPTTVASGASYGSGRCLAPRQPGCQQQTFDLDQQNVQFRVPTTDASGASVLVRELTATSSPADIGFPVEAHATGLSTNAADPAILTFRYDERLLGGRGWDSVDVFRRADGTTTYVRLSSCLGDGRPRSGQVACVDRRGLAGSSRNVVDAEGSGSAPDVIMVVRTVATSRWVAR
jgi:hypothetical protein